MQSASRSERAKACRDDHTVVYARVSRLFTDLELAHGDGRFPRLFRASTKCDLLILDDWGPEYVNARAALLRLSGDRTSARFSRLTRL